MGKIWFGFKSWYHRIVDLYKDTILNLKEKYGISKYLQLHSFINSILNKSSLQFSQLATLEWVAVRNPYSSRQMTFIYHKFLNKYWL